MIEQLDTVLIQQIVTALPAPQLVFNPFLLVGLIIWFNVCLDSVQRVQINPGIPASYRLPAMVAAIVLGPFVVIAALLLAGAQERLTQPRRSLAERLQARLKAWRGERNEDKGSEIKLVSQSGRTLAEVFGEGADQNANKIIRLTHRLMNRALTEKASDVLIDPTEKNDYAVRFRVDGVFRNIEQIDADTAQQLISSIKAVANMDIAERRRPQDGAFVVQAPAGSYSCRIASAGVVGGEKISVRIHDQSAGRLTFETIGLTPQQRGIVQEALARPSGMILVCGPTGSGKTSTLYAMLNAIDRNARNVITVEDPIEYILPGTSQIEVNTRAGITFGSTLRGILRQAPDVICVGEIRDNETAGIAVSAAQTGHLLLATIHSHSNAAAIVRLLDLGVSPLLIGSGLTLVISQRLVRRLCAHCREAVPPPPEAAHYVASVQGVNEPVIYNARGCAHCQGTGFAGRQAIFDILSVDDALKSNLTSNQQIATRFLRDSAEARSRVLEEEAWRLVAQGVTSLDEMGRTL